MSCSLKGPVVDPDSEQLEQGLLPMLASEHVRLSRVASEVQNTESADIRLERVNVLFRETLLHIQATNAALVGVSQYLEPRLMSSVKRAQSEARKRLQHAREILSDQSIAEVRMALDELTLVVEPQIYFAAAFVPGTSWSDLARRYRTAWRGLLGSSQHDWATEDPEHVASREATLPSGRAAPWPSVDSWLAPAAE